jgi:RHS repeat-associated protein
MIQINQVTEVTVASGHAKEYRAMNRILGSISMKPTRTKIAQLLGCVLLLAYFSPCSADIGYEYAEATPAVAPPMEGHWAFPEDAESAVRAEICQYYGVHHAYCSLATPNPVHCNVHDIVWDGVVVGKTADCSAPYDANHFPLSYDIRTSPVSHCNAPDNECYYIQANADPRTLCGDDCDGVGDPINPANASVTETVVDIPGIETSLPFRRFYNSAEALINTDPQGSVLSPGWRHSFSRRIVTVSAVASYSAYPLVQVNPDYSARYDDPGSACVNGFADVKSRVSTWANATANYANNNCFVSDGGAVIATLPIMFASGNVAPPSTPAPIGVDIVRDDGQLIHFTSDGTSFAPPPGISYTLEQSPLGYTLTDDDDAVEHYDTDGKLISVSSRAGVVQTLTYGATGRLATVTNSFGYSLSLTYNEDDRLAGVSANNGQPISYGYDYTGLRLGTVTQTDGTTQTYRYLNTNDPSIYLLQTKTNEDGAIESTWAYDTKGRATSERRNSLGSHTLAYNADGSATVTDPLTAVRTFTFGRYGNRNKITGISGSKCFTCVEDQATTYDFYGYVSSRTDYNGNVVRYTHDATRGLVTSRTEASGTPRERTVSTTWHSEFRLPLTTTEANRLTSYTHDVNGNVLTKTVTDTTVTPNVSRTWTYAYDQFGRILTEDGPRTDVSDTTTYAYYNCTSGAQCGQLHSLTNALGQVTTFDSYNADGQPTQVTDANGVVTSLAYDSRQRLTDRCNAGALPACTGGDKIHFDYWPTGLLRQVTFPDASYLAYSYTPASLLSRVDDGSGNRIDYFYDAAGNSTGERVQDHDGVLARAQSRSYNSFGQLSSVIGSAGTPAVTTSLGYDGNGNLTTMNAPLGRNSTHVYDELNRLAQSTDAGSGNTRYTYDTDDHVLSVVDAAGSTTQYQYDGFGEALTQLSPQSGSSTFTYDPAGNVSSRIDARGNSASYSYDAVNRVTQIAYADKTITFGYDAGIFGKGLLTSVADDHHSLAWSYDALGRVIGKGQTVGGTTLSIGYGYNNGKLSSVVTPSGQTVLYGFDANSHVSSVSVNGALVAGNVVYEPFGPVRGWTWASGQTETRLHDADGNFSAISGAEQTSYRLDNAFRITGITNANSPDESWGYAYDNLDRIVSATQPNQSLAWTYDAVGNRQSHVGGTQPSYSSGDIALTYNSQGRLSSYVGNTAVTYLYDALGERIQKSASTVVTMFAYDEAGHLIGEYSASGALIQETVWLGDIPIATLRPRIGGGLDVYNVHADHQNAPRAITRSSDNAIVWRWRADPYGTRRADENPSGLGNFVYNLRYPGQYYDLETGLNYNYFRDYDPAIGRYAESDPIGLNGGINTYAYANGNPLSLVDPYGLASIEAEIAEAIASGDTTVLESLLEGANPTQENLIRAAIDRLNSTADQLISKECQASVRGRFPKSVLNNTLKEIKELAKEGDSDARTAWKLLNDLRFKK